MCSNSLALRLPKWHQSSAWKSRGSETSYKTCLTSAGSPWGASKVPGHCQAQIPSRAGGGRNARARGRLRAPMRGWGWCATHQCCHRNWRGKPGGCQERKQKHKGPTFFSDVPQSPSWVIYSPTSICLEKWSRDARVRECVFVYLTWDILVLLSPWKHLKYIVFPKKILYSVDEIMLINRPLLKWRKKVK